MKGFHEPISGIIEPRRSEGRLLYTLFYKFTQTYTENLELSLPLPPKSTHSPHPPPTRSLTHHSTGVGDMFRHALPSRLHTTQNPVNNKYGLLRQMNYYRTRGKSMLNVPLSRVAQFME